MNTKTIAFLLPQNPYLPELKAYTSYFTERGFNTINIADSKDLATINYDVEWHFMGIDRIKPKKGVVKIHDYASLSTPPFPKIKDFIKRYISQKPHVRLFLNEKIKNVMNFKDKVPYCFRDVGVNKSFLEQRNVIQEKEFDFCYLGTMHKVRKLEKFLVHFKDRLKKCKILMIGAPSPYLSEMFKEDSNITFTGKVDYLTIPVLLNKCKYAINYVPDEYPFNVITAVKVMEYCACGLKIISNKYEWVENFGKKENASFFYLKDNFENFTMQEIEKFDYRTPDMKKYDWNIILEESKILELINSSF